MDRHRNYGDDYWDEEQLLLHYHFFGENRHDRHFPVDEALARQLQELDGVWDGQDEEALAVQLSAMENSLETMSLSRTHGTATRLEKTLQGSSSSSAANQDDVDIDNMTYEEISQLQESIGGVSKGLSKEKLSRLPTYAYKSSRRGRKLKEDDLECVICQTEFSNGDKLIALSCLHKFHDQCIRGWLKNEKRVKEEVQKRKMQQQEDSHDKKLNFLKPVGHEQFQASLCASRTILQCSVQECHWHPPSSYAAMEQDIPLLKFTGVAQSSLVIKSLYEQVSTSEDSTSDS